VDGYFAHDFLKRNVTFEYNGFTLCCAQGQNYAETSKGHSNERLIHVSDLGYDCDYQCDLDSRIDPTESLRSILLLFG
jgi:hypothetical protein